LVPRDLAEKSRKDDLRVMQERLVWQEGGGKLPAEWGADFRPDRENAADQRRRRGGGRAGDFLGHHRAEAGRDRARALIGELKAALAQIQTLGRLSLQRHFVGRLPPAGAGSGDPAYNDGSWKPHGSRSVAVVLLAICAGCKKIRDDQGYWNQVDVYIRKHTGTEFTHGLCPDCIKKYFPGLEEP